jgi:hypothetical protein
VPDPTPRLTTDGWSLLDLVAEAAPRRLHQGDYEVHVDRTPPPKPQGEPVRFGTRRG